MVMSSCPEFYIRTTCGRNFAWSANNEEQARRDMRARLFEIEVIMPYEQYERWLENERLPTERV